MFYPTPLPDVVEIRPKRHGDDRGWLSEVYREDRVEAGGISPGFIQDNMSFSALAGTVRGLHFQRAPHAQAKLVTCLTGRILDVAVDIRPSSETFNQHVAVELSAETGNQLFVPAGFAHGFCTLTPDCRVLYKLSAAYWPEAEAGIAFDDPALGIVWPVTRDAANLSDKDAAAASFEEALSGLSDGDVL